MPVKVPFSCCHLSCFTRSSHLFLMVISVVSLGKTTVFYLTNLKFELHPLLFPYFSTKISLECTPKQHVFCQKVGKQRRSKTHSLKNKMKGKKKAPPKGALFLYCDDNYLHYLFTAFSNSDPALNLTTFLAAIWIFSPDAGLTPWRAGRSLTANVPKPTNCTLSPATSASFTAAIVASKAFFALSAFRPAPSATFLTNSDLFIILFYLVII